MRAEGPAQHHPDGWTGGRYYRSGRYSPFRPIFERLWPPAICSAVYGSAWPKMCRETAHPAVAVVQREDGVPAISLNGV